MQKNTEGELDLRIAGLLFKYRNSPHATTGMTPAELLLGWTPRTHLDLLHPDLASRVEKKQVAQKQAHDNRQPERSVKESDAVVCNFQKGEKWLPGLTVRS